MIYENSDAWFASPHKRVVFFAMSGLGKTHMSSMLRATGQWYHYSIDYRIGTRYLNEAIDDNLKRLAMKEPYLRELLLSDSIRIKANLSFDNLSPVAGYLGQPGDETLGGLPIAEYRRRQEQFRVAEMAALMDTGVFLEKSQNLYDYPNFVCDTGGSIVEWADPDNPDDPILKSLSEKALLVWIKGSDAHTDELIRRFNTAPKPMAYRPEFLTDCWTDFIDEHGVTEDHVNPYDFIRYSYKRSMVSRQPRYAKMAEWGVTVDAGVMGAAKTADDFARIIGAALDEKAAST